MITPYFMMGEVLRPHGIHGEAKVRPYARDPEDFRRWETLYLKRGESWQPIASRYVRFHDGHVYLLLGTCSKPEDVEKLRGETLWVERAQVTPLPEGMFYISDLTGCEAVDAGGKVYGTLTEVLQHGPVDVWVFRAPDGQTFMAPSLPEVFPEKDVANNRILVCPERLEEVAVYED